MKEKSAATLFPWALDKGVSGIPASAKAFQFSNNGPYVQQLENDFLRRIGVSPNDYGAISCCNGTTGLNVLALLYRSKVDDWFVQSNTFWSDVQNSLNRAIVLPMRDDGKCGPLISPSLGKEKQVLSYIVLWSHVEIYPGGICWILRGGTF